MILHISLLIVPAREEKASPIPYTSSKSPFSTTRPSSYPSCYSQYDSYLKKHPMFETGTPVKKKPTSFVDVDTSPRWLPEDKDMTKCKEVCG